MPDITYPATFTTIDGRTVTFQDDRDICGHCSRTFADHIARGLSCGESHPGHNFREWDTNDELAPIPFVGQQLPDDTWAAAALVGVGGRFRVGAREYEVKRLPGVASDEYPSYPDNAIVHELNGRADVDYAFPIVQTLSGDQAITVTRIGPASVERYNLFIAVAMAGGRGGRIANNDGGTLRIVAADQDETGCVLLTSNLTDDSGAITVDYSEHPNASWTVVEGVAPGMAAQSPVDAPESTAATPTAATIIPRTMSDAAARIAALENLSQWLPAEHNSGGLRMLDSLRTIASWLDGGERQQAGHNIAANHPQGSLCGSYEGLVCTTFGWSPRRSYGRWERQLAQWQDNVNTFESDNSHQGAADTLALFARLYEAGGLLNQEANQYIVDHLEESKVFHVGEVFEKIGWEAPDCEEPDREYQVRVPVTRPVTYTETGYATVTVTASDEDDAMQLVSDHYGNRDLASRVDDWETDSDSYDYDDYSAEAMFSDAEVV